MVDKLDKPELSTTTNIPNAIPMAIPISETSKNSMKEKKCQRKILL